MKKEKSFFQQFDYSLLTIIFILTGISLVAIYSATTGANPYYFVKRQLVWYAAGFVLIFAVLFIDYRRLRTLSMPFYGLGLVMLLAVALFGDERNGSQRWIEITDGIALQPSEFMKVFLIIAIAQLLTNFQEKVEVKSLQNDFILTGKIGLLAIIPFLFILKQPDLGTALVLLGIVAVMLLISGISWRILFLILFAGVGIIAVLILLYFLNFDLFSKLIAPHQLNRIYGWLDPQGTAGDFGYQLVQAMLAIGSGQLLGRGLGEGIQAQGGWIPEVHTDFIFAVIGEEFGFIGASILISVYFILIYRLVQIALSCNDLFGTYLVSGIIGMILFQVFQNIGMTIGLVPITGLALPFISYGGSALLANMLGIGIVLNVAMRTKTYMFD